MRLPSRDEPSQRPRHLVATIGPASQDLASRLASAGATAFRLNASHLVPGTLDALLSELGARCPDVPVVVDLQGAKMRLGRFDPLEVSAGHRVDFGLEQAAGVPLPHPELFEQVREGDTLSVDDGRLRFRVAGRGSDRLSTVAEVGGTLRPRKGVNVEPHPVELRGLTRADAEACRVAAAHGVSRFAFSFMRTGEEAAWVRARVPGCEVVGKIERAEAAEHLEPLAALVDGVWVCRGDLGAQLGAARLARVVASIDPRRLPRPVLMAGQVLEHLTEHQEPTRSEVCHLHDLLARGYAGIVLSDETAIGRDPVGAVAAAAALLSALG